MKNEGQPHDLSHFQISGRIPELPRQRNFRVTDSGGIFLTDVWAEAETRGGNLAVCVPTFSVKNWRVLSDHKCIKVRGIFQKLKVLGHFRICIETKVESEP